MLKKIFFIILLSISSLAFCDVDKEYIGKFSTKFHLKPFVETSGFNISLLSNNTSNASRVNYNAFIPTYAGVSLNIMGVGASFAIGSSSTYLNSKVVESTNVTDVSLNFYRTWLGYEGYFQYMESFYRNNRKSNPFVYDIVSGSDIAYSANSKYINTGVSVFFIPNFKKYSYNAGFNQNEFQKKTAMSVIFLNRFNYQRLWNDAGLIPLNQRNDFESFAETNSTRVFTYAFMPGYAINLAYSHLYLAFLGALGPAFNLENYKIKETTFFSRNIGFNSRLKTSLGYNGKSFFTGVFANYDYVSFSIPKIKFSRNQYSAGIFVGYRFIKEKKK
jgi:hypothetical protein